MNSTPSYYEYIVTDKLNIITIEVNIFKMFRNLPIQCLNNYIDYNFLNL